MFFHFGIIFVPFFVALFMLGRLSARSAFLGDLSCPSTSRLHDARRPGMRRHSGAAEIRPISERRVRRTSTSVFEQNVFIFRAEYLWLLCLFLHDGRLANLESIRGIKPPCASQATPGPNVTPQKQISSNQQPLTTVTLGHHTPRQRGNPAQSRTSTPCDRRAASGISTPHLTNQRSFRP